MTAKLLSLAEAFRTILRRTNPDREDLHQIDSYRWFHDRQSFEDNPLDQSGRRTFFGALGEISRVKSDAPAYEALDLLKTRIANQEIRLHGVLKNSLPGELDPIHVRKGSLDVFAGTLTVEHKDIFNSKTIYTDVHCYADDLALPKGKGGRSAVVDWAVVNTEVERLMNYHGDFGADAPDWNAQARLVEALQKFCVDKFGVEPGKSTIEERIKQPLAKWRKPRA